MRYAFTFLDQKQAFMYRLVDTLIDSMGTAYPEIAQQRDLIMRVIKEEEDAFLRTLDNGIRMLDTAIAAARKAGKTEISWRRSVHSLRHLRLPTRPHRASSSKKMA